MKTWLDCAATNPGNRRKVQIRTYNCRSICVGIFELYSKKLTFKSYAILSSTMMQGDLQPGIV